MQMTNTLEAPEKDRGSTAVEAILERLRDVLAQHSVTALRASLGLVIAGFGLLKFIDGASPAEGLVMQTTEALTLGVVSGHTAVVATAVIETLIGLGLLAGRPLRPVLTLTTLWLGGILAPVVLFPGQMFPDGFPTLTAQYVLKDIILVAATAVVAARALGARMSVDRIG